MKNIPAQATPETTPTPENIPHAETTLSPQNPDKDILGQQQQVQKQASGCINPAEEKKATRTACCTRILAALRDRNFRGDQYAGIEDLDAGEQKEIAMDPYNDAEHFVNILRRFNKLDVKEALMWVVKNRQPIFVTHYIRGFMDILTEEDCMDLIKEALKTKYKHEIAFDINYLPDKMQKKVTLFLIETGYYHLITYYLEQFCRKTGIYIMDYDLFKKLIEALDNRNGEIDLDMRDIGNHIQKADILNEGQKCELLQMLKDKGWRGY